MRTYRFFCACLSGKKTQACIYLSKKRHKLKKGTGSKKEQAE